MLIMKLIQIWSGGISYTFLNETAEHLFEYNISLLMSLYTQYICLQITIFLFLSIILVFLNLFK